MHCAAHRGAEEVGAIIPVTHQACPCDGSTQLWAPAALQLV
jgi:hypothetical protein